MALKHYICDVETTGLSIQHHEVTQISIIRCDDRVQFSRFIRPKYPERTTPQALTATGRTMKDLEKGEGIEKIAIDVEAWLQEDELTPEHRCFTIHSISGFDRRFIHTEWSRLNRVFPVNIWFDTEAATRDYFKSKGLIKESARLSNAISKFGITVKGQLHDATVDTQATYRLRERLLKEGIDHLKYTKRIPQE